MIVKNPCKTSLVRSSVSPHEFKEQRFLTRDELEWLSDCINLQYKELVLFAGLTGLRKGELFALETSDIANNKVTVTKSLTLINGKAEITHPKTKRSIRTIDIPKELQSYFNNLDDGPVFPSIKGSRVQAGNFRNRYFQPAVKASIGEPFRFHDLRHTAVALAIKENKHPFEISKMLGHTSIKTTFDVYGHLLS